MTPRLCEQCARPLTRKQMEPHRQTRFCSIRCGLLSHGPHGTKPAVTRDVVLSILQGNMAWWMTVSDLAIWVYGHDDMVECHAIRETIRRLRRLGHVIERRELWLPHCRGNGYGYRLIEQVQQVAVSA